MRDTTVEVRKLTFAGKRWYRGGQHVVTPETAKELVESKNARILGEPEKDEKDAIPSETTNLTTTTKAAKATGVK